MHLIRVSVFRLFAVLLFGSAVLSCKKDSQETNLPDAPENEYSTVYYNLLVETDKAVYHPGETVTLTINGDPALPAKVRYRHLKNLVFTGELAGETWTWNPPDDDFRGYFAEVYDTINGREVIYGGIGIDVSSDWTKFPRYGFLSKFGSDAQNNIQEVLANLNRYHINGLQFYDWHNKHHRPLPMNGDQPLTAWKDIGNRDVSFSTVDAYIKAAHSRNMKAMFYNLLYGAWDNAMEEGVSADWYLYTDNTHANLDFLALSNPFLSNIYLLDPSNPSWQQYLMAQNGIVYEYLDFDGYHIDQLGDRGTRYTRDGSYLDLPQSFGSFLQANYLAFPGKYAVMNAVNQFGQPVIGQSQVGFLYTEVWSPNDTYKDLASLIRQNTLLSGGTKNQVLAAYVNYQLSDSKQYFNEPSVLLADAVIFSFGGAHLEMGEHMLSREYFPFDKLRISDQLQKSLTAYYDFLVAYQNLLRDGGVFNTISIQSTDGKADFASWPAAAGFVAVTGKQVGERQVIHLINFTAAVTSSWRDNAGAQPAPAVISNAGLTFRYPKNINRIWMASPDISGGSPIELLFLQQGDQVSLKLPSLKYWNMLVIE